MSNSIVTTSVKTKTVDFKELETKYTQKFSKLLYSDAIQQKKITLVRVLEKNKITNPEKIIKMLKDVVEAKIFARVYYFALAQYTFMEKSGDWTEAGEDRVKLSYIRLLLNIPVENEISFNNYSEFEEMIRKNQVKYKLNECSVEQLRKIVDYPELIILGKAFNHNQSEDLNRLLEILGSKRRIMMGTNGSAKSIIFGVASSLDYGKYNIHFFSKEEIRTPNCVHYIVAIIEQKQIAIRREVCKYVFYNKWMPIFDYDMFQMESLSALDEENVGESIKKAVAKAFNSNSREDMEAKQELFLEVMSENLVCHELAHDALEDSNLNQTELLLADGLTSQKESILSIMTEVMTEWMPKRQDIKGPLKNIVDTSFIKNESEKAKQMLLIYMSDAWFLDTDTKFMYPYTYIMFTLFLNYMDSNQEIDFVKMYKESSSIFEFLSGWYRNTLTELYVKVKNFHYMDGNEKKTFKDLDKSVRQMMDLYEKDVLRKERNEKEREGNFWINFFTQLARKDKAALNQVFDFIEAKQKDLYTQLLQKYATTEDQEKYGQDIHHYVINKMKEKGFSLTNVEPQ